MNRMETLVDISTKNGGVIETKIAVQHGISRATLSMYCKQNKIKRIGYGLYALQEKEKDRYNALSKCSEKFVFSHDTALFLHGISAEEPIRLSITVKSGYTPSVMLSSSCSVYYIKRDLADLGKTKVKTSYGNEVPVYDLERTICDMVRSHKRVGEEKVLKAIKGYISGTDKDVKRLFDYAEQFHISLSLYKFWKQAKMDIIGTVEEETGE